MTNAGHRLASSARIAVTTGACLVALLLAACTAAGSAATSPPPGGASASPAITSASDAADRVLTEIGLWPGLKPFDPTLVGECCGYRVEQAADGWTVTIDVGWDDCPAGCINHHRWRYLVHADGTIVDQGQDGPPVPSGLPGADGTSGSTTPSQPAPASSSPATTGTGIRGIALAGPTCPVVRPNDPACADRPVAGAVIHVVASDGHEVARATTDAAGQFSVSVPAGDYEVSADPVAGLMRAPSSQDVPVHDGFAAVQLEYDTGIR